MSVRDYLEHLKGKPEPVRRAIALSTAGGLTLVVLLGWLTAVVSSGVLAFDSESADVSSSFSAASVREDINGIAGAAAALDFSVEGGGLTVVETTKASSTLDREDTGEATVIPF